MVLHSGDTHYSPISWKAAFALIAEQLNGLDQPDQAIFYTSGRTSNEAAFLYQCFSGNLAQTICLTVRICAMKLPEEP
jgi:anaerobic selenocysteine-containing dehydrogenase